MSDLITTGTSEYATGGIDSATVLVSNVSPISAKHPNGLASAIVQVETILGSGTSLKGTKADLVARLAVALDSSGKLNLTDVNALNGPLLVSKGGTGQSTAPLRKTLIGNGSTFDLVTTRGFIFNGPISTSTIGGGTITHEGAVTYSTNQGLDGLHCYSDFTLNAGVTLTLGNSSHRLLILATGTVTINGIIDAIGAGSTSGRSGYTQVGGGGGDGTSGSAAAGGSIFSHSVLIKSGGAAGVSSAGGAGVSVTSTTVQIAHPFDIYGGACGGTGAGASPGAGGNGGGSIIIVAPVVILGASSQLKTSGSPGAAGGNQSGGGGGGGAGNVYIFAQIIQNNGVTITKSGGTAGAAGPSGGFAGGAGAAGALVGFEYTSS